MAEGHTLQELQTNFSLKKDSNFNASITNDHNDLLNLLQEGQQAITLAARDREENNQSDKIPELDNHFKKLLDIENNIRLHVKTIETMRSKIAQGGKVSDPLASYDETYANLTKEQSKDSTNVNADPRYKRYKENIWSINHPDEVMPNLDVDNEDDDIVMGPSKISLKCPLTQTWFKDPVTSSVCKHTFSRDAIYSLLSRQSTISCPIPGCSRQVNKQVLQPDPVMADRVERAKAKQEKEQNVEFFDV